VTGGTPLNLLEQFTTQTGRQPADWTSEDTQNYLDYVKTHVAELIASKRCEARLPVSAQREDRNTTLIGLTVVKEETVSLPLYEKDCISYCSRT
jgi:hypothetical protein